MLFSCHQTNPFSALVFHLSEEVTEQEIPTSEDIGSVSDMAL